MRILLSQVGFEVPGYLGTWILGNLGTWIPGYLGTQVSGYLGTLLGLADLLQEMTRCVWGGQYRGVHGMVDTTWPGVPECAPVQPGVLVFV